MDAGSRKLILNTADDQASLVLVVSKPAGHLYLKMLLGHKVLSSYSYEIRGQRSLRHLTWRICAGQLHTMVARTGSIRLAHSGQTDDGCGGAYLKRQSRHHGGVGSADLRGKASFRKGLTQ
jgi:hypothetical protein